MGNRSHHQDFFRSSTPTRNCGPTELLCTTTVGNPLYWRGPGHFFHRTRSQSTRVLSLAVQDVGKTGTNNVPEGAFSNHPDLHSRVLENRAVNQAVHPEGVHLLFHFSSDNYGDYCLCIYLLLLFLPP